MLLGDAVASCKTVTDGGGETPRYDFLCSAAFAFTTESMANALPSAGLSRVVAIARDQLAMHRLRSDAF